MLNGSFYLRICGFSLTEMISPIITRLLIFARAQFSYYSLFPLAIFLNCFIKILIISADPIKP